MSEFSFNNDNREDDIDIDYILESLNNTTNDNNINHFTKKLENELSNYNINQKDINNINLEDVNKFEDKNLINNNKYNLLNSISKDIIIYTLIFIIINLIFINKYDNKYLFLIIKVFLFIVVLIIIKKYNLL
jgi:hypothetical protein